MDPDIGGEPVVEGVAIISSATFYNRFPVMLMSIRRLLAVGWVAGALFESLTRVLRVCVEWTRWESLIH